MIRSLSSFFLALLLLLLFIGSIAFSSFIVFKKTEVFRALGLRLKLSQLIEDIHILGSSKQKGWELWAKRARIGQIFNGLSLDGVRATFRLDNGIEILIFGREGWVQNEKKDIILSGGVELNVGGYMIRLRDMRYSHGDRKIISQEGIQVLSPDTKSGSTLIMQANKMEIDLSRSKLQFFGDIFASSSVDEEDFDLRSASVELDIKNNRVDFLEKVVANFKKINIVSQQARVYYDLKTKKLLKLRFFGGVEVDGLAKRGRAEQVDFYWAQKKYVLSGNPYVTDGSNKFFGEKIILLNAGETVRVVKARAELKEKFIKKASRSKKEKTNQRNKTQQKEYQIKKNKVESLENE